MQFGEGLGLGQTGHENTVLKSSAVKAELKFHLSISDLSSLLVQVAWVQARRFPLQKLSVVCPYSSSVSGRNG